MQCTTIRRVRPGADRFGRLVAPASPWIVLSVLGTALLAGAVVGSTLWSQSRAASGIAYSDQWAWVAQYRHIVEHGLTFDELMAQNNEHRLLFPRLVFLLDMVWARGSDRINLVSLDVLQGLVFAMIVWMGREALRSPLGVVAVLASAAFLGNAGQREDVYWGFQVQFVMVYAAAAVSFALLAVSAGRGPAARFRLASSWTAATVATFSMANGILAWPILCVILALRSRRGAALCTLGIGAAELMAYLHGYQAVPNAQHTGVLQALAHPVACLSYLLVYLGGLLSPTGPGPALAAGCGLLVAWTGLALWSRRHGAGSGPWRIFAAAVVLFAVLSGMLTAVGRFSFGSEQALSGRYLTPGALLWSTLLVALAVETRRALTGRRCDAVCLGMAVAVALVATRDQLGGIEDVGLATRDIQMAADAYVVGVRDDAAMAAVTSDDDLAWSTRPFLAGHRLGPFGKDPASDLGQSVAARYAGRSYGPCRGSVDRDVAFTSPPGLTGYRIDGWAWGVADGLPSHVIVVDADGEIVGFARIGQDRPDVAQPQAGGASRLSGFTGYVKGQPREPLAVFAVSGDGRRLCPIRGILH